MPLKTPEKITRFEGDYAFLSSSYAASVVFMGTQFWSAEAAFQACKATTKKGFKSFARLDPKNAIKKGRTVKIDEDWTIDRLGFMFIVTKLKFDHSESLKAKLIATHPKVLVNGNDYYDTFWGVWENVGSNWLGKILMKLRREYLGETSCAYAYIVHELEDLIIRASGTANATEKRWAKKEAQTDIKPKSKKGEELKDESIEDDEDDYEDELG
jgi:ribA/ribD-fused uncharacterized protein